MLTIDQFYDKHDGCDESRQWAIENCSDMADAWGKIKPETLVWVAGCHGVLTYKELRLFIVFCARQFSHLLTDNRSINAIEVAERFANGNSDENELTAASDAAYIAVEAADDAAENIWHNASPNRRAMAQAMGYAAGLAACTASKNDKLSEALMIAVSCAIYAYKFHYYANNSCEINGVDIVNAQAAWLRANTAPKFD